jgi:hypothetical protein
MAAGEAALFVGPLGCRQGSPRRLATPRALPPLLLRARSAASSMSGRGRRTSGAGGRGGGRGGGNRVVVAVAGRGGAKAGGVKGGGAAAAPKTLNERFSALAAPQAKRKQQATQRSADARFTKARGCVRRFSRALTRERGSRARRCRQRDAPFGARGAGRDGGGHTPPAPARAPASARRCCGRYARARRQRRPTNPTLHFGAMHAAHLRRAAPLPRRSWPSARARRPRSARRRRCLRPARPARVAASQLADADAARRSRLVRTHAGCALTPFPWRARRRIVCCARDTVR